MNLQGVMPSEIVTEGHILPDSTHRRFVESSNSQREENEASQGPRGGGQGSLYLTRTDFQCGRMRKVLEMDGNDGCTALNARHTTELCT